MSVCGVVLLLFEFQLVDFCMISPIFILMVKPAAGKFPRMCPKDATGEIIHWIIRTHPVSGIPEVQLCYICQKQTLEEHKLQWPNVPVFSA